MEGNAKRNCPGWREALAYLTDDCGRKIGQTKLFEDVKKGKLRKQADGSFKPRDLDRYASSLPTRGTSDVVAEKAADRQRRKEETDIRRTEAAAKREEFRLDVEVGRYILRDMVYQELAARSVTLCSGLKTAIEAQGLDLVALAGGDPKKSRALVARLESLLDEALNEYSREIEFEVQFVHEEAAGGDDGE